MVHIGPPIVFSNTHKIHVASYMTLKDTCQPSTSTLQQEHGCLPLAARLPNYQVISSLLIFEYIYLLAGS